MLTSDQNFRTTRVCPDHWDYLFEKTQILRSLFHTLNRTSLIKKSCLNHRVQWGHLEGSKNLAYCQRDALNSFPKQPEETVQKEPFRLSFYCFHISNLLFKEKRAKEKKRKSPHYLTFSPPPPHFRATVKEMLVSYKLK